MLQKSNILIFSREVLFNSNGQLFYFSRLLPKSTTRFYRFILRGS